MAQPTRRFQCGNSWCEVASSFNAGPFMVAERRFPGGYREPLHYHGTPYLQAVLAGSLTEAHITHQAGSVGYQPVGEHASSVHDDGLHALILEFPQDLTGDWRLPEDPGTTQSGILLSLAQRMRAELRLADAYSRLAIEGLAYEMIAAWGRQLSDLGTGRVPAWLRLVIDLIHDSRGESLSLTGLAEEAGVHSATLSRTFRKHTGQSVAQYVRASRIDHARELLSQGEMTVGEIASATGFADQSHLGRVFKEQVGMSPIDYKMRRIF